MSEGKASDKQPRLFDVATSSKPTGASVKTAAADFVSPKPFREWAPDQGALLPTYLRDELGPKHLACFIVDLRHVLDFEPILRSYTSDRGQPAYHPVMMTLLLMYAYAVGVTSSRKIAKMCETDLAFRYISGGARPDHDTICAFRVRHLAAFKKLFVQTVEIAQTMGLVKLGHIAIDGTKVEANASKHKSMSYERMPEAMAKLEQEIERLLKEAEALDAEEDRRHGKGKRGDELPDEFANPAARAAAMKKAKAAIDEVKKKRELAEEKARKLEKVKEAKAALEKEAREKAKAEGKKEEEAKPDPKAQRNFTDPESRIMAKNKNTFVQGFNAQVAVEAGSQIIVGQSVGQTGNDANKLSPMVTMVAALTGALPAEVSADSGYFSEPDIQQVAEQGVEMFVATVRQKHGAPPAPPRGRIPAGLSFKERMGRKLRTDAGRRTYAKRKVTVEPAIGQFKNRGFRRFSMRGLAKAEGEFSFVAAVHNVMKLFRFAETHFAAA